MRIRLEPRAVKPRSLEAGPSERRPTAAAWAPWTVIEIKHGLEDMRKRPLAGQWDGDFT